MNRTQMDPVFSEALRAKLVEQADGARVSRPRARKHRRLWLGAGVFAGLCVLGGAGAMATGLLPLPGAPAVTQLGAPVTETHFGSATVELGAAPSDATDVSVTFTCLSAGTFAFPNGAALTCSDSDASSRTGVTTYNVALAPGEHAVTIQTGTSSRWRITAEYVNRTATNWKVNAGGQTYGIQNGNGTPDLITAQATNGREGYVKKTELEAADGTTASESFTSPADAVQWQETHAGKTVSIPVYTSDGTTVIGSFVVGTG
ncbi:MAG TPA: peptidase M56 family protein [Microbacteriaceae bacterium]